MTRRIILLGMCFIAPLLAVEQTVLIGGPTGILLNPGQVLNEGNATLNLDKARSLIERTLGGSVLDQGATVIIHVLRWKDDGKPDQQNWYLYHNGTNSQEEFTGLRIFGQHKISVVYVHLNAKAASEGEVARYTAVNDELNALFAKYSLDLAGPKNELLRCVVASPALTDTDPGPDPTATLMKVCPKATVDSSVDVLDGTLVNAFTLARKAQIDTRRAGLLGTTPPCDTCKVTIAAAPALYFDHYFLPGKYTNVGYKVVATPKLPSAIGDLFKLFTATQQAAPRSDADLRVVPVALWGGDQLTINAVPSDIKVTPVVEDNNATKELDSRVFDNEGLYFWDVSVGLPIKSIKETTYDQTGQTFTAKTVERQSLYAMFNVFPFKLDTKASSYMRLTPALLIGVGVNSHPLDRLMFGGGLGIAKVQFFAGAALTKKQFPQPGGGLSDPVYRTNLVYGLNVPIRQILGKLKAAK